MICFSDIYIPWTKLIAKLGGPRQQPILACIGKSVIIYSQECCIPLLWTSSILESSRSTNRCCFRSC